MKKSKSVIVPRTKNLAEQLKTKAKGTPLTPKQRRNIAQRQAHFEATKGLPTIP
jgi:hypothetical protein